jgi:hypothetical protein
VVKSSTPKPPIITLTGGLSHQTPISRLPSAVFTFCPACLRHILDAREGNHHLGTVVLLLLLLLLPPR